MMQRRSRGVEDEAVWGCCLKEEEEENGWGMRRVSVLLFFVGWTYRQTDRQMSDSRGINVVYVINPQEASCPAACPAVLCYDYLLVLFLCSVPEESERRTSGSGQQWLNMTV